MTRKYPRARQLLQFWQEERPDAFEEKIETRMKKCTLRVTVTPKTLPTMRPNHEIHDPLPCLVSSAKAKDRPPFPIATTIDRCVVSRFMDGMDFLKWRAFFEKVLPMRPHITPVTRQFLSIRRVCCPAQLRKPPRLG